MSAAVEGDNDVFGSAAVLSHGYWVAQQHLQGATKDAVVRSCTVICGYLTYGRPLTFKKPRIL